MDRFPGKTWVVSHKPIAVAAGLGHMGIHRNVIHPKFGNFILLGTVLVDATVTDYTHPIDYNPCLECRLCVSACPVGAIAPDGHFNFSACYTHNYREFMSGFTDWAEAIADSDSALDYRHKVIDSESASMWQSLSFKSNYKAAYCMAACPAGEDVIGPFLANRKAFVQDIVKPLREKSEPVYVVPVQGLEATYHFTFTGAESRKATVIIRDQTVQVHDGHTGTAKLKVTADSQTWLRFLAKEYNLVVALLQRKIRIHGSPKLLQAFGNCFPS
jgi:NAD-dependent dihydropyrimidine dehydrogenase PreA subunit/putative sterol carrier protein